MFTKTTGARRDNVLFHGVHQLEIVDFNPSAEKRGEWLNIQNPKPVSYFSKDNSVGRPTFYAKVVSDILDDEGNKVDYGEHYVSLDFYVQDAIDQFSFNDKLTGEKITKFTFADKRGNFIQAQSLEEVMTLDKWKWFAKGGESSIRNALVGESRFYEFLKAATGGRSTDPDYEAVLDCDFSEIVRGTELGVETIKDIFINDEAPFKGAVLGVMLGVENGQYQTFWKNQFLREGQIPSVNGNFTTRITKGTTTYRGNTRGDISKAFKANYAGSLAPQIFKPEFPTFKQEAEKPEAKPTTKQWAV